MITFFKNTLSRPGLDVECHWELSIIINLVSSKCCIVKFKSLEVDDEDIATFVDECSFMHFDFLIVLFTIVFVVSLQDIRFNVRIKCLFYALFVFNIKLN